MRKMKDSKIEWVGEIPETWRLERLQWHLDEINAGNNPIQTENILSLTNKLGVVPYEKKGNQGNKSKENIYEYKLAYPNTIVANSMNILIGSVGLCEYFGCVSPVYYVFRAKKDSNIKYLHYVFQTAGFQRELRKYANGILEIRLRVSASDILKRPIPYPPLEEQQRIADFLDRECERIDGLKADIEAQIETLEKYKRSVITEAVTHGLDSAVPMKDSGVGCIGEIPAHWTVAPLKSKFSFGKGLSITKTDLVYAGVKVISYGQIHAKYNKNYYVDNRLYRFVPDQYLETASAALVRQGDFIFADTSEDVEGAGNFVYIDKSDLIFAGYHCITLKNRNCDYGKYLAFLFMSQKWKNQVQCRVNGVKLFSITKRYLAESMLILPPLSEQQAIADYLDEKCAQIDELISQKQSQIETLETYKKSLIFEYVTGKKEVC